MDIESYFTSGRVVDVILVGMAVEVLAVSYVLWRCNQGAGVVAYVASLLSGASLVLALGAALTKAGWLYVAMYLGTSLLAHVADIALRILMAGYGSGQASRDASNPP